MGRQRRLNRALKQFRAKKVLSLDELVRLLSRSRRTAQRQLKEWGTYTSYNQNGRYYVLPDIPTFDEYGLWKFKDVFFSMHGNLMNTVTCIVNRSEAGLTASEIGAILGIPPYTFLSHLKDTAPLAREKHDGVFVYLSTEPAALEKQRKEREQLIRSGAMLQLPSDADAVIILTTLIKHPDDTLARLVRRVRRKGIEISTQQCRNLLLSHNLLKKTTDSASYEA
jgi:hypothetical protein